MGTLVGNLLAVVLIGAAALVGFISLEASATIFVVIAYGLWLLIIAVNFSAGRAINEDFQGCLNKAELRAFRRYNVHIRTPGAGEIFSALLNFLRLAGFVWAGLCVWQGHYFLAGLSAAFFLVSGGIILRTHPFLYMERHAQAGNDVAAAELGALQSLKIKRDRHLIEPEGRKMAIYDEETEQLKRVLSNPKSVPASELMDALRRGVLSTNPNVQKYLEAHLAEMKQSEAERQKREEEAEAEDREEEAASAARGLTREEGQAEEEAEWVHEQQRKPN